MKTGAESIVDSTNTISCEEQDTRIIFQDAQKDRHETVTLHIIFLWEG